MTKKTTTPPLAMSISLSLEEMGRTNRLIYSMVHLEGLTIAAASAILGITEEDGNRAHVEAQQFMVNELKTGRLFSRGLGKQR